MAGSFGVAGGRGASDHARMNGAHPNPSPRRGLLTTALVLGLVLGLAAALPLACAAEALRFYQRGAEGWFWYAEEPPEPELAPQPAPEPQP